MTEVNKFKAETSDTETNLLGSVTPSMRLRIDSQNRAWVSNVTGYIVVNNLANLLLLRNMIDEADKILGLTNQYGSSGKSINVHAGP